MIATPSLPSYHATLWRGLHLAVRLEDELHLQRYMIFTGHVLTLFKLCLQYVAKLVFDGVLHLRARPTCLETLSRPLFECGCVSQVLSFALDNYGGIQI